MNELYRWDSPDKHIPVGTLVRFVFARPRFQGEDWRDPGDDLAGKTAIVLAREMNVNGHQWGGLFQLHQADIGYFSHYGDFLEIA